MREKRTAFRMCGGIILTILFFTNALVYAVDDYTIKLFGGVRNGLVVAGNESTVTLSGIMFKIEYETALQTFTPATMGITPSIQRYTLGIQIGQFGWEHFCDHYIDSQKSTEPFSKIHASNRFYVDVPTLSY